MVHYVNTDALCVEICEQIKNNYSDGSLEKRFLQSEKSVLKKVKEIIRNNKKDILFDLKKR